MTDTGRVGVLGCGLMGSGIAQVAAAAGYETIVRDVSQEIWERARGGIEKSLAKLVEKGKLSATDRDAALKRLAFTTTTGDLKGCDIIIEAVTEDLALKNALWSELDRLCGPRTIFASNTSSLTIAAMAAATGRAPASRSRSPSSSRRASSPPPTATRRCSASTIPRRSRT